MQFNPVHQVLTIVQSFKKRVKTYHFACPYLSDRLVDVSFTLQCYGLYFGLVRLFDVLVLFNRGRSLCYVHVSVKELNFVVVRWATSGGGN